MQIRNSKGLKPLLVKYTALLIGVCYLMNPLQQQVFEVIHVISHTLELPDNVLSHDIGHDENMVFHKSQDHHADVIDHNHEFIDLVKTIFKASDDDHKTQDENIVKVKCDKHLVSDQFVLSDPLIILEDTGYPLYHKELNKGYLNKLEEPPQKQLC